METELISQRKRLIVVACLFLVMLVVAGSPYPSRAQTPGVQQQTETKPETALPPKTSPETEERTPAAPTRIVENTAKELGQQLQNMQNKASLELTLWGVTWLGLITCFLALAVVAILDRLMRGVVARQLRDSESAEKPRTAKTLFLEALSPPLSLFIWVYGIYGTLSFILVQLHETPGTKLLQVMASRGADLGGAIAVIWLAYRLVVLSDVQVKEWAGKSRSKIDELLVGIVGKSLRIAIILIGGVMVLQNVTGIQMAPLIASLGLGGLAIALAAKDYVANFLGTLTLIFDKPFLIGDQVVIDKFEGTVDSVGFRSTRIRTAEGNLLSIPNSKLIDSPLQNVTRRPSIRWQTTIGLSYENPPEKVSRAVEILVEILHNHEGMREDLPPRVFFNAFKDWSLNITILAWYHSPNWWDYEAWLQKTCMAILEKFHAEDIRFALPTQVVQFPIADQRQFQLQALKGEQTP